MSVKTIEETAVGFAALGLDARLVEALKTLGYEEPTPIQREAIPPLLEGSRPDRPGGDGHGEDGGIRAADAASTRRTR